MKEAELAVPLLESQIEAANRLHQRLQQWSIADKALSALQACFPGFDREATLLKVVVVNQLYGTNILAVTRMAEHVTTIMLSADGQYAFDLVEHIASFSGRKHLSFASKFAHFFIDMERFPIYDSFARKMVNYHLGKHGLVLDKEHPYKAFLENIDRLKRGAHLSCTNEELDHYLWLAGVYRQWLHDPAQKKMNVEVADLFKDLASVGASELAQFWPGVTHPALPEKDLPPKNVEARKASFEREDEPRLISKERSR